MRKIEIALSVLSGRKEPHDLFIEDWKILGYDAWGNHQVMDILQQIDEVTNRGEA